MSDGAMEREEDAATYRAYLWAYARRGSGTSVDAHRIDTACERRLAAITVGMNDSSRDAEPRTCRALIAHIDGLVAR